MKEMVKFRRNLKRTHSEPHQEHHRDGRHAATDAQML
jgi:hypothetical protein